MSRRRRIQVGVDRREGDVGRHDRRHAGGDGGPEGMSEESQAVDWRLALAVEYLSLVAVSLVWSAMVVVSYHDLRIAKEGAESKEVAKIFE